MVSITQAIDALKSASINKPEIMRAPSENQIQEAELKLGFRTPPSFRTFLEEAGAYQLPYWETYWIGDESLGYRNIIEANMVERGESDSPLPLFLITFHNNGMGDQDCFDTRQCEENGEYKIIFWDHEISAQENLADLTVIADDFAEWLFTEVQTQLPKS